VRRLGAAPPGAAPTGARGRARPLQEPRALGAHGRRLWEVPRLRLHRRKRLGDIFDQVFDVFHANGEAHQAIADAERFAQGLID